MRGLLYDFCLFLFSFLIFYVYTGQRQYSDVFYGMFLHRYNFNKVAQYKQLTLEEAEEKMKNRKKTADGYERWMMKVANNGPAAFGEHGRFDDKESITGGGRSRKKTGEDDEGNVSDKEDREEEDDEEEAERKNRFGQNKKGGGDDDDDEGPRGGDLDDDDFDVEKGEYLSLFVHDSFGMFALQLGVIIHQNRHMPFNMGGNY